MEDALLTSSAAGVYVICPTPFESDGRVDAASTDRMVEAYLEAGATGLTILGIMGEAPKLAADEALAFARQVIATVAGRVPVVVGVSAAGFAAMAGLSSKVMDAGAAGVMIAPPSTLKTDDQIVSYYADAVEAIGADVPWVIQDYPLTTNVVMTPNVIMRIIEQSPSCVMLKHEDWPGLDKITALRRASDAGRVRRVSILCGNGGMFLPFEMERGADGAMTGYAYPEMLVGVVNLINQGRRQEAHDLFDRHLPLVRYETQPGLGLAVRKYVLKRRGIIASDTLRKPGPKLSPETIAEIEWMMERIERP
ncbi:dihydrodipicolinate synthase family protein [Microvirga sp. SYSU G3D207]|uniref:Dihydrodipicolinate synthase family protein n=1 Tax=Microvirga arsenatis TaxID=2692265 RepID=A0ABW9YTK2_9HYPH|nr:dihydrodipicolinate synthase family protein [Microvirga arsenatis]NBJ09756.1 dihydrodipicolinate synthase family protein [Microvirga arsenatis]NBJ23385.1 dihydrodipicolinate synthase family protein [Microvirga arsenatis]